MHIRVIIIFLFSYSLCIVALNWSWRNIRESNCNKCACMAEGIIPNETVKNLLSKKIKYKLMANQLGTQYAQLVFFGGKIIKSDADIGRSCYKLVQKNTAQEKFSMKFFGPSEQTANTKCERMKISSKFQTHCTIPRQAKVLRSNEASMYKRFTGNYKSHSAIAWTSEGKYYLLTICFGTEGYTRWVLLSTEPFIDQVTKKNAMQVVSKLGFDSSKAVKFSTEQC